MRRFIVVLSLVIFSNTASAAILGEMDMRICLDVNKWLYDTGMIKFENTDYCQQGNTNTASQWYCVKNKILDGNRYDTAKTICDVKDK